MQTDTHTHTIQEKQNAKKGGTETLNPQETYGKYNKTNVRILFDQACKTSG